MPDLLLLADEAIPDQASSPSFFAYAKNNGDGTFQVPVLTPLPNACPEHFVVGNFNNDGKLDVMGVSVGCRPAGAPTLVPFLGNGDGTFRQGTTVSFNTTGYPTVNGMLAVDVNDDGKLDLLISGSALISAGDDNALYEMLGNGDGTFKAPKLLFSNPGTTSYFATADLNKDGIPDLVEVALDDVNQLRTYLGHSDGTFQLTGAYGPIDSLGSPNSLLFGAPDKPLWPREPVLGDFNGDGNIDILMYLTGASGAATSGLTITGAWGNTILQVLAGNGDGTFTPSNLVFSLGDILAPQLAIGINGSQYSDLVEMDRYSSSFDVVTAQPGASFSVAPVSDPVVGTTGKLQITLAFPSGAAKTVQLSASDPKISIPASVTITAGTVSQNVNFQIGAGFNPSHVIGLTGKIGNETHTAYVTQGLTSQGLGFIVVPATAGQFFSPVVVAPSQSGSFAFDIESLGGYSTQIQPSCQGLPATAVCQFGTTPIGLGAGALIEVPLTITTGLSAPLGTYSPTVVFTDGTVTQQLTIPFGVGQFALSISPGSATAPTTGSATYNLLLTSTNGYYGPVQISISELPTGATGEIQANQDVTTIPLPFDIETQNVTPGTYPFTVTGTAGSLTHTASATLVVQGTATPPGFTGSISPTSATLSVGQSANFAITLTSQNGATGTVTLQCLNVPSGTTCAFNPLVPTLPANGTASDTLTVQVNSMPAASTPSTPAPWSFPAERLGAFGLFFMTLAAGLALAMKMWRRRRRLVASAAVLLSIGVLFVATASCGGGGGGGSGPAPTPPQSTSFTITVQASGAGVATAKTIGTLTITVN